MESPEPISNASESKSPVTLAPPSRGSSWSARAWGAEACTLASRLPPCPLLFACPPITSSLTAAKTKGPQRATGPGSVRLYRLGSSPRMTLMSRLPSLAMQPLGAHGADTPTPSHMYARVCPPPSCGLRSAHLSQEGLLPAQKSHRRAPQCRTAVPCKPLGQEPPFISAAEVHSVSPSSWQKS